ncbi:MAG: hypothetical protein WBW89_00040 [Candidatus Cybelea sp.]
MENDTTAIRERLERAGEQACLRVPSDLARYVDVENVQTDARGEIVGLDETISDLRKTRPYLFEESFKYDPSRPIDEQLAELDRRTKSREDEAHQLVSGLNIGDLSDREFQDVLDVYTKRNPDVMARGRLEAARKRQSEGREAERRGLHRGI